MDKNWKDKDTIRFLKLYEKEKCLWDYKHENYRNQSTRKASVLKILQGMNKPGLTESEVRNKIRNIRSTYAQELAKFIRALKDGRKDYMSSLIWFPMAHNFLRKVVASKSLEKNTDSGSTSSGETQDIENASAKVKKPPMVGDQPNSAENSENSNDSQRADSPFDSPSSPVETNTETIETSNAEEDTTNAEELKEEVSPSTFNSQGVVLNAANIKVLETPNSGNSQADAVQNVIYLQDILNAANSKIQTANNVNYQVVDAQNLFYLQDSLSSARQIVDLTKCSNVQVLQVQSPISFQNSLNPTKNIEIPIEKTNNMKDLQVQHPVSFQNSLSPLTVKKVEMPNSIVEKRKKVETPKSNIPVIEVQSPVHFQNSTNVGKRKRVETPNSDNVQMVEEQNPASLQNSTKPKRKRKVQNTVQVQEPTKTEDYIQDEFFHFSQNVASQLRKLPLKSALLCQAKILETIAKERIAAAEKISTAPTVLPLVAQQPERFNYLSNVNGDYWESDHSDD